VINTSKRLYCYNRLPISITSTPAIFERTIESILQGIPNVSLYMDNILIVGKSDEEHLRNQEEMLSHLKKAEIHLN